jgi:hypothetical protein
LRIIVKNNKTSISDVWILNVDLLISQEVKDNIVKQKDEYSQIINPLNVFYTILLMRKMILIPTKRLFVDKISGELISKSRYTSMMHKEMQKMGIPTFFTAYSLKHAAVEMLVRLGMELPKINKSTRLSASNNAVCTLIK